MDSSQPLHGYHDPDRGVPTDWGRMSTTPTNAANAPMIRLGVCAMDRKARFVPHISHDRLGLTYTQEQAHAQYCMLLQGVLILELILLSVEQVIGNWEI